LLKIVKPFTNPKPSGNLPPALTSFIGREPEVAAICQLMLDPAVRLVTLYGTAGIGKTRLSLAVGEKIQEHFRDGVFFVNLAPLNKPELGLAAIAQVLGLQDYSQLSLLEKLQHHLQKRELLLILDNFEQILALSPAVSALLVTAPHLKIMVTSRIVLRLYGEHIYTVPTLQLLALNEPPAFEILCQNEAIKLFCQRAAMVNPHFKLTAENAETITRLCHHLEGLPLAIELAAARCDLFSPETLLIRLGAGNRFELLNNGFSNLPARQQSLASALEWSYQLLSVPQKELFRKLGVFAGSCSLEAAVAVGGGDRATTFEVLWSLLNKSLLKPLETAPGEELRFTMLDTLREFALEKLSEIGELEVNKVAYSYYFIAMAETGVSKLKQPDHWDWYKRLETDHPNVLKALDYLIEIKDAEGAFRLGGTIWRIWWRWGYLNQARQWLNKVLKLDNPELENRLRAKVLDGIAYIALYQCDYQIAKTYFEQSIKIWREYEANNFLGSAISGLAGTYRILGDYDQALELNYEALELFRLLGEKVSEADSLCNVAWQLMERGNYELVQTLLEQALAIHTEANYLSGIARTKIFLGDILWRKNDPLEALRHLEESTAIMRDLNYRVQLPNGLNRLGLIYLCQGKLAAAGQVLAECLEVSEEMEKTLDLIYVYSNLGLLKLVQNDLVEAERFFRQSIARQSEIGQLEGVVWALEGLAVVAIEKAQYPEAHTLMQEAQNLRKKLEVPVLPHTLKFILPKFISFQNETKPSSRLPDRTTSKSPATKTNLAMPPKAFVTNKPAQFLLSNREKEVLQLVAEGHPNSKIAKLLIVSPGTVNNHLSSIYSKFGVNSRTAAVRYALDHSLL
jgi:predicted ATPase/DNA-binding CsgD family transcriptional regulator